MCAVVSLVKDWWDIVRRLRRAQTRYRTHPECSVWSAHSGACIGDCPLIRPAHIKDTAFRISFHSLVLNHCYGDIRRPGPHFAR